MENANGYIVINGQPIKVYEHPAKHEIADIVGLEEALERNEYQGTIAEIEGLQQKLDELQEAIDSKTGEGHGLSNVSLEKFSVYGETVEIYDELPPNEVTNITSTIALSDGAALSWTASDSPDVVEYLIYNGDTLLGTTTNTSYNIRGLFSETDYLIAIKSKDADGNISNGATKKIQTVTTGMSGIKSSGLKLAMSNLVIGSTIPNSNEFFSDNKPFTLSVTLKAPVGYMDILKLYTLNALDNKMKLTKNGKQFFFTVYGKNGITGAVASIQVPSLAIYDDESKYSNITLVRNDKCVRLFMDGVDTTTLFTIDSNFIFNETTQKFVVGDLTKAMTIKNVVYYDRALSPAEVIDNSAILKGE